MFYCREPGVMVFFLSLIYLQVLHWQSAPNDGEVKALREEKNRRNTPQQTIYDISAWGIL